MRRRYPLSLWHVPIFQGVLNQERMARLAITRAALTLLHFAMAFAGAAVSFSLLELPISWRKERFRDRSHT